MVLERGPSAPFLFLFFIVPFLFRSVLSRRTVFLFHSALGVLSWRTVWIPLVLFLIKNVCIPPSVHSTNNYIQDKFYRNVRFIFGTMGSFLIVPFILGKERSFHQGRAQLFIGGLLWLGAGSSWLQNIVIVVFY